MWYEVTKRSESGSEHKTLVDFNKVVRVGRTNPTSKNCFLILAAHKDPMQIAESYEEIKEVLLGNDPLNFYDTEALGNE